MVSFDSTFTYDYINLKTIKDYDNRSDKIKYVPKDWTTSPFDLIGSTDNLDSVSMRGDLLRPEIHARELRPGSAGWLSVRVRWYGRLE